MRILLTGAAGQVGTALARALPGLGDLVLAGRDALDLSHPEAIAGRLSAFNPDLIVNAAAYTAVDRAETERDLAYAVNAAAVEAMGRWAAAEKVPLIHFSTDYVFDGRASEPYRETDPVNPLSVYGKSKAEGERLLLATGAPCLIVRTSWVYAATGKNFVKTIARLAGERSGLAVVSDQMGTPTSAAQIASFVRALAGEGLPGLPALFEASSRLVHFTASGWTTWHGFACAIVAGMKRRGVPVKASEVRAIPTSDYPTPAERPQFSRLSTARLQSVFNFHPEPWERALDGVLDTMFGGKPSS